MAYISRPLVRKFCKLDVLIYLNLKSFQTILRNRSTLTPIFFACRLQTSSDFIDLTGVFYQKILQHNYIEW